MAWPRLHWVRPWVVASSVQGPASQTDGLKMGACCRPKRPSKVSHQWDLRVLFLCGWSWLMDCYDCWYSYVCFDVNIFVVLFCCRRKLGVVRKVFGAVSYIEMTAVLGNMFRSGDLQPRKRSWLCGQGWHVLQWHSDANSLQIRSRLDLHLPSTFKGITSWVGYA